MFGAGVAWAIRSGKAVETGSTPLSDGCSVLCEASFPDELPATFVQVLFKGCLIPDRDQSVALLATHGAVGLEPAARIPPVLNSA